MRPKAEVYRDWDEAIRQFRATVETYRTFIEHPPVRVTWECGSHMFLDRFVIVEIDSGHMVTVDPGILLANDVITALVHIMGQLDQLAGRGPARDRIRP